MLAPIDTHRALRRFGLTVPAVLLLIGCTIEPTPQEYIDRQPAAAEQAALAQAEVRNRLMELATALETGDGDRIQQLLQPQPETVVFGPGVDESGRGEAGAVEALLATARSTSFTVRDVLVSTGPQHNVAWFHAIYASPGPEGDFRLTGVLRRQDGQWRLQQGHVASFSEVSQP